ncbi:MAG: mechanosensitive ion channel family protein [Sphingobacteriaceae bacterium]|nr:mechanosensitive ion channel family protein [Sphingobacteriaceae bacterium]
MESTFFDQIYWGNSVKQYTLLVLIILLGLLFKKILSKIFSQLLFKIFKKFAAEIKVGVFLDLLLKPFERLTIIFTLYFAANQLDYPLNLILLDFKRKSKTGISISEITIGDIIDKAFLFFFILTVTWIVLRLIDFIAHVYSHKASLTESKADDQIVPFVKELTKAVVCFIGFFMLLGYTFEINVLTLITGLGISGIAIALAAKETLENLIGSFTIFIDKPFIVGDIVKVKGIEGTIEKVGFRSTLIRTNSKTMATVPNKGMVDGVLENISQRNYRKINFHLSLSYQTKSSDLKQIIIDINQYINTHEHTTTDGIAYLEGYFESAIKLEVEYFVHILEYNHFLRIKEEINFKIREIVEKNHSEFVFVKTELKN